MKKLMVMLGAVAMSFGLFAADYTTSFEPGETGYADPFVPDGTDWKWDTGAETSIALGAYTGDAYKYTTTERRFDGTQTKFLPLSTSGDTLTRTIGEGNFFVDQLVKFTGFEDDPDFTDDTTTKIAVWMKATETEGATAGETNLYVSVGKAGGKENVKLDGEYQPDTWYRLTIKSLGNVIGVGNARAGFLIYIDGKLVSSADATDLFDTLTTRAAEFQKNGQLFPAMISGEGTDTFETIGYKGIGAIDDIVIDAEGPEFAKEVDLTITVDSTLFAAIEVTADGTVVPLVDGKYTFAKGAEVAIEMTPVAGKIIKSENPLDLGPVTETQTIDLAKEVEVVDAVALIGTTYYETLDEVLTAIEARQEGETIEVEILKNCENTTKTRAFSAEGTIEVDDTGWGVDGDATFVGVDAALEMITASTLTLSGAVTDNVKAEVIAVPEAATIALAVTAEIATKTDIEAKIAAIEGYTLEKKTDTPSEGWTTYWFKEIPKTFEVTATPAQNGEYTTQYKIGDGEFQDYTEAFVVDLDKTATIKYTAATGYTISAGDEVQVTKDTEPKTVPAPTFAAKAYKLNATAGANTTLTKDPEADTYAYNAQVTLTAALASGDYEWDNIPTGWNKGDNDTYTLTYTILDQDVESGNVVETPTAKAKAAPVPDNMNGASKDQKDAYTAWVAGLKEQGITIDTSDDATAIAFALSMTDEDLKGYDTVEKAVEAKLATKITPEMVAAIAAGGLDKDGKLNETTFQTLEGNYVNAVFTFVTATELESTDTAKFYHLSADFKPANN